MEPLPSTIYGRGDPFASTHWSVVFTAARYDANPEAAEAALADLCGAYWAPLYTFARSRGHSPHDAQDLTQSFFAHLVEHRIYERPDPQKGKFRSFLLAAMKNFLTNAREREQASKRGGQRVHLPLLERQVKEAESFYQAQHPALDLAVHADRPYELSWAQAVVDAATERVARSYLADGKQTLFAALKPFIAGNADTLPVYEETATTLGMQGSTLRSHVTRLRAQYREALHAEVRRTVDTESEVRNELSTLLRVLTDG